MINYDKWISGAKKNVQIVSEPRAVFQLLMYVELWCVAGQALLCYTIGYMVV